MNSLVHSREALVPGGDLSALIAKLEAAEGGSRELDARVAEAMGWSIHNARRNGLWVIPFGDYAECDPDEMFRLGDYTTSLDAALALAERVVGEKNALHILTDLLAYEAASADFDLVSLKALPVRFCAATLKAHASRAVEGGK